jgi:flagellar protein FliL
MSAPKPAAADTAVAAEPKKGGKLKLIIIAAVVVLAGGGAGAYLFLKPGAKDAKAAEGKGAHESHDAKAAPQYFKFEPAFVVNFGEQGNTRFLQVTVEAMSRDPLVVEAVKSSEPIIRNDLVLLFSSQKYEDLLAAEGKEKLRQATLEAIRKAIAVEGAKPEALEGVYFTSFVIQ